MKFQRCWICGHTRGSFASFVIGPMCAVNRVSSEPPSHRDCAIYAAQVCPFLTRPKMKRNEKGLEADCYNEDGSMKVTGGYSIKRNPGVTLVWTTRDWEVIRVHNGYLIQVGDPTETLWFAKGQPATRQEVMDSIDSGLPLLAEMAQAEGPDAVAELNRLTRRALTYLPPEAS